MELDIQEFSLEKLVMDTVNTMAWHAAENKLELPCYVDPSTRFLLKGDSYRLRQVLVNLVGNAIKFTETGAVTVTTKLVAQQGNQITVRFSVADTGIGIAKEKIDQLFQSFSQVDTSTTRNYGGTGLGLAISRKIVELMGGTMGIESEVGFGSTFWFEISFVTVTEANPVLFTNTSLTGMRVLIVDDNSIRQAILKNHVTEWGLDPVVTSSVDEALAAIERAEKDKAAFSLVLSDYIMPQRTGLDLADALKDHSIKIVLLSGTIANELPPNVLQEHGIDAFLRKPVYGEKLYQIICELFAENEKSAITTSNNQASLVETDVPTSHILLAEDNSINRIYATELIKQLGHTYDVANNGHEVIKLIRHNQYDLVLMDCQMPELDGFEATKCIRKLESKGLLKGHIPIIALTANAIKGDREQCLDAGMDFYLSKPVQKIQIANVLKQFLGNKQAKSSKNSPVETKGKGDSHITVPAPIDADSLLERCFGNLELVESLLDELELTGRDRVKEILQKAEERDAIAMAEAAHSLKGATGILCISSLQKLAAKIEQSGNTESLEGIESLTHEISNEMERCLDDLPRLREEVRQIKERGSR